MRQLKQRSIKRDLAVRPFYLDVIGRTTMGPPTLSLRWRYTGGRHATWRTVQAAIVSLPRPIQAVYARLNSEAVKLNERASALRRRLREIVRGELRAGQSWGVARAEGRTRHGRENGNCVDGQHL